MLATIKFVTMRRRDHQLCVCYLLLKTRMFTKVKTNSKGSADCYLNILSFFIADTFVYCVWKVSAKFANCYWMN